MEGWIKIHRQIIENEFYFSERFTKQQAWVDLLLLARHNSGLVTIRGIDIKLNPGQLCYSQLSLSKRWQWDRKKVKKFLNQLKKREMVDIKISKVTTIITIKNWFSYQGVDNKTDNRIPNRFPTNKNDKNEKNVRSKGNKKLKNWLVNTGNVESPDGYIKRMVEDTCESCVEKAWGKFESGRHGKTPSAIFELAVRLHKRH